MAARGRRLSRRRATGFSRPFLARPFLRALGVVRSTSRVSTCRPSSRFSILRRGRPVPLALVGRPTHSASRSLPGFFSGAPAVCPGAVPARSCADRGMERFPAPVFGTAWAGAPRRPCRGRRRWGGSEDGEAQIAAAGAHPRKGLPPAAADWASVPLLRRQSAWADNGLLH